MRLKWPVGMFCLCHMSLLVWVHRVYRHRVSTLLSVYPSSSACKCGHDCCVFRGLCLRKENPVCLQLAHENELMNVEEYLQFLRDFHLLPERLSESLAVKV